MSNFGVNEEDGRMATFNKGSDAQSVDKLYDKYSAPLYGIIIRIVNDEALATEVLTKVFLNAQTQAAVFNIVDANMFSYLFKSSRQLSFHALEQQQLQNLSSRKGVYDSDHTAFDLLYYKGLNYSEAAAVLNKTVEEVKAEVRAAIKNLKTREKL